MVSGAGLRREWCLSPARHRKLSLHALSQGLPKRGVCRLEARLVRVAVPHTGSGESRTRCCLAQATGQGSAVRAIPISRHTSAFGRIGSPPSNHTGLLLRLAGRCLAVRCLASSRCLRLRLGGEISQSGGLRLRLRVRGLRLRVRGAHQDLPRCPVDHVVQRLLPLGPVALVEEAARLCVDLAVQRGVRLLEVRRDHLEDAASHKVGRDCGRLVLVVRQSDLLECLGRDRLEGFDLLCWDVEEQHEHIADQVARVLDEQQRHHHP
mmetsp:Transcript_43531/g.137258  ORF Transcript_43531/g.137258 Transcript_43531/m.137258 type:complete len:265 (+) Transcript_43531:188-982(+)